MLHKSCYFSALSSTSHVILDEIHERDVLSDFLMIVIRDLTLRRKDLKIILMSATLNAQDFANYFCELLCLHYLLVVYTVT